MRELADARALARTMVRIGDGAGRRVAAVLSSMEEPLGRTVGNALEVREAIETLRGEGPDDLLALTLQLGTQLLLLAGEATDAAEARARLAELHASGAALARFERLVAAQGGDTRVLTDLARLPTAPLVATFDAPGPGWVSRTDAGVEEARRLLAAAYALSASPTPAAPPVHEVVTPENA
jgi:thymidine phosphorylase